MESSPGNALCDMVWLNDVTGSLVECDESGNDRSDGAFHPLVRQEGTHLTQGFHDGVLCGAGAVEDQVCPLTQFSSVDFLQLRIGLKMRVFNTRGIKVCIICF